jgi:hypothetical protein
MDEEPPRRLRRWVREEIRCGSSGSRSLRSGLEDSVLSEEVEKVSRLVEGQSRRVKSLLDTSTSALLFLGHWTDADRKEREGVGGC